VKTERAEYVRKNIVREYFSRCSGQWDSLYDDSDNGRSFTTCELNERKKIVFDFINGMEPKTISKVLDLGCGSGRYLAELYAMGFECCGADVSEEMLTMARKNLPPSADVKLIHADCCSVPLEDHQLDLIICAGVLEYLSCDMDALREMRRLIRPSGFVILTFPNLYKLRNLLNPYYYLVRIWTYFFGGMFSRQGSGALPDGAVELDYGKSTVTRYSLFCAGKRVAAAGFRIVEVRNCGFGPFSLWKNEMLPAGLSVRISKALEGLLTCRGFSFLRFLSNGWVILARPEIPVKTAGDETI